MGKKWFFSTFIITLMFLSVIAFFTIQSFSRPVSITKTSSALSNTSSIVTHDDGYILRNYNGKIGIFAADSDSPMQVLDISIDTLPDEDQQQLAVGIYVPNQLALQTKIEDYS